MSSPRPVPTPCGLGGEEGLEYLIAMFGCYSRSLIRDADAGLHVFGPRFFSPRADHDFAAFGRSIDRVVENICPHLAQTRAAGLDFGISAAKRFSIAICL